MDFIARSAEFRKNFSYTSLKGEICNLLCINLRWSNNCLELRITNPFSTSTEHRRAAAEQSTTKLEKAIKSYEETIKRFPKNADCHALYAQVWMLLISIKLSDYIENMVVTKNVLVCLAYLSIYLNVLSFLSEVYYQ